MRLLHMVILEEVEDGSLFRRELFARPYLCESGSGAGIHRCLITHLSRHDGDFLDRYGPGDNVEVVAARMG